MLFTMRFTLSFFTERTTEHHQSVLNESKIITELNDLRQPFSIEILAVYLALAFFRKAFDELILCSC